MDKRHERRAGFYWVDDKPYITVTNVLKIIDKPALRYWYGKEVYRAVTLNPGIGEREALSEPYKSSGKAKDRGTAVHDIVEAWKNIGEVAGKKGPFQGYAKAFESWLGDNRVKVEENERTVVSHKHRYAGTLDMLARINGDNLLTVIDVKTGKDLYPEVHLQLSAYRHALEEQGVEVKGTAAVLLREDGTYKYETGQDRLKGFLAAKALTEELDKERLIKFGYLDDCQKGLFE